MGVPKFFRWLTERFPQINIRISEGRRASDYVDNFYLDMNGIIHQCTHGDEVGPSETPSEEEMVERILAYTERLIAIARPRKVLYLAIDGVAPRAKMNQQRSRRYRVPRELKQQALRDAANAQAARTVPEQIAFEAGGGVEAECKPSPFDSNCITPGTEFLQMLGRRYEAWIEEKLRTDPAWIDGPKVIFSGAEVPGEGEHKIMDYIREVRQNSTSPDETRHCMYGLDADLIMLGMITHETHFSLLRERQKFQKGRFAPRRRGGRGRGADSFETSRSSSGADDADFVYLELELLRNCLAGNMRPQMIDFEWEVERAVDDFVFMCMLVGNDFIPGLPNLDVADGALNLMMRTYVDVLPLVGGYLTNKAEIHMDRFETFVSLLAKNEAYVVSKKLLSDSDPSSMRGRGRERDGPSLGDPGDHARRYYLQKLGIHPGDKEGRRALVRSYLEGLTWCLNYYHLGCRSWNWYYPDFYTPLASDLRSLSKYTIELEMGKPFPPLAQLLSVLPPQSGTLLPTPYRELMLSPDSPVFDAFPIDFVLDQNGKRNEWEATALLPFIDEDRLLTAIRAIDHEKELTEDERARNLFKTDRTFLPAKQREASSAS